MRLKVNMRNIVSVIFFTAASCNSPEEERRVAYERIKDETSSRIDTKYAKLKSLLGKLKKNYSNSNVGAKKFMNSFCKEFIKLCFGYDVVKEEYSLNDFISIILDNKKYHALPPFIQKISKEISNQMTGNITNEKARLEIMSMMKEVSELLKLYYDLVMLYLGQKIIISSNSETYS